MATPCGGSSTAKGWIYIPSRNLALEFVPDHIHVNAIALEVVETPLVVSK